MTLVLQIFFFLFCAGFFLREQIKSTQPERNLSCIKFQSILRLTSIWDRAFQVAAALRNRGQHKMNEYLEVMEADTETATQVCLHIFKWLVSSQNGIYTFVCV